MKWLLPAIGIVCSFSTAYATGLLTKVTASNPIVAPSVLILMFLSLAFAVISVVLLTAAIDSVRRKK